MKLAPQVKVECLVMMSAPQVRELVGTTGSSTEEGKGGGVAATKHGTLHFEYHTLGMYIPYSLT